MRVGVGRVERDRPLEAFPRFLATVGSLERHAQAVVRQIVVGRQPQRLCETRQRRCRLGEVHERGAAAAMRRGQIGLQCQRALVTPERLGVASDSAQGSGEVGLYCRVGRLQVRRRPDEPQCLRRLSERRHGEAHEVQGVAIEGLAGEYVAIQRQGFRQASLVEARNDLQADFDAQIAVVGPGRCGHAQEPFRLAEFAAQETGTRGVEGAQVMVLRQPELV